MNLCIIKKTVVLIFLISVGILPNLTSAFSDVPASHPYYWSIENIKNEGVIKGYEDGTFKPEQLVSRAEALTIILKSAHITSGNGLFSTRFTDVPIDSWFSPYVFRATTLNIIQGNPDGTFAPTRTVNKAEFIKMALVAFKSPLPMETSVKEPLSNDITSHEWFVPFFSYAKNLGIIYPDLRNRLEPEKMLSRAEAVDIIYKLYLLQYGGETQKLLSITEAKLIESLVQLNNNNLENALTRVSEAVFYSQTAVTQDPASPITKAANQLAQSFENLYRAYQGAQAKNYDQLKFLIETSKDLANQALINNPSLQKSVSKIHQLGDTLQKQLQQK